MAQRFWGYHIRVLIENLVDSGWGQFFALPADEEIGAVRLALLEVLPQSVNNFVVDVDQPLFVALADDTDLPGRQVNLLYSESSALAAPDTGIGKEGHNGVVPLAAALQEPLAKSLHIFLRNGTGTGVLQLDFHEVVLQHNGFCLSANLYEPVVAAAQGGQMAINCLGAAAFDVAHIGDILQHICTVELLWPLAEGLLAPDTVPFHIPAVPRDSF